jgi:hypothetical protein
MMLGGVASPTLAATSIPSFHTPTGNIGCEMAGGWLRCDIGQKSWGKPARPQGCQLDYGDSFSLKATGKPIWSCHGDTALHLGRVLAYGTTWHVGAFTCVSRITGLTCTNSQGHGFFLSRQSYRLF